MTDDHPVIVFDGVCVLCNRWVDVILRHDRANRFRLAAMQGAAGHTLLQTHGLSPDDPASLLLVQAGHVYVDSEAIIRVLRQLDGSWPVLGGALKLLPRFTRDPCYRWLARHRYRLFGKRAQCRVPTPDEACRFLD